MCSSDELEWCLSQVRDGFWKWFVTLQCFQQTGADQASHSEIAFATWIHEIAAEHGRSPCISYIRTIELSSRGETLSHVLLEDVPDRMKQFWKSRWRQLSGGAATDRPLHEAEALFEHFVRGERCDIECSIGWNVTVCRAERNAD
jgi:hypothetical protein